MRESAYCIAAAMGYPVPQPERNRDNGWVYMACFAQSTAPGARVVWVGYDQDHGKWVREFERSGQAV